MDKRIPLSVALLFASIGITLAQSQYVVNPNLKSVGPFKINMSSTGIKATMSMYPGWSSRWVAPTNEVSYSSPGYYAIEDEANNIMLSLVIDDQRLVEIIAVGAYFATPNGVHPGIRFNQLAKLEKGYVCIEGEGNASTYATLTRYPNVELSFVQSLPYAIQARIIANRGKLAFDSIINTPEALYMPTIRGISVK